MRVALVFLMVVAAACGRNEAQGRPGSGSGSDLQAETEREQARFDVERRPEEVVKALGIKAGSRVADIGAGSGLLTVHLARAVQPSGRVVATDIDGGVLELMHSRLQAAGLAEFVERRVVGADTPGLEHDSYDAILLAEVDHHFADAVGWLRAATLGLKPGGRIVISNRIHHRARSMAAAAKAGLVLLSESTPVPSHFIAVFVPAKAK